MTRRRHLLLTILLVTVAACTPADETASPAEEQAVVEVFTNYRGRDADAMRAVLDSFTDQTGIPTRHVGTAALALRLPERIRNGDPPDVALVPQPALVAELARDGHLSPIADVVGDLDTLLPGAAEVGLVDGVRYGVWFKLSVKSLVWFPPAAFAEAGYQRPGTLGALMSLSGRIAAAGGTPWCLGLESFGATGWVGTDWIEDLVLRLHGPAVYDQWVAGEIPFTDQRIAAAFEAFGEVALNDGWVLGGPGAALTTPALGAITPMLEDPPACLMTRQGSFQETALPDDTEIGPDGAVDVFVLPPTQGSGPAPLLAAGEIAVAFDRGANTSELIDYLADPAAGEVWAASGGFTSPHGTFDRAAYAVDLDASVAGLVADAEVIRFDGSDQMPREVGAGTFWTGVVDYLAGTELDVVLSEIQAGYDDEAPEDPAAEPADPLDGTATPAEP